MAEALTRPEHQTSAWVFVLYSGEGELWHQRRRITTSRVFWATNYFFAPDGDCYPETYDMEDVNISAV